MACPDLDMVREVEKFASRVKEIRRASTGEIGSSGTDIHVEKAITAEDII